MICTQCKKRNAIGDKFCRECGVTLPLPESPLVIEEATRAERERLNERVSGLLSAAYTLAEQKRYDQALPLAEEAVLLLPDSSAALSLLATLYEYSGQDEKAIRTMERVVALNPESPGDRQKLGELRRAFQQAHSDEPFPIRGAAAAGRAAATVSAASLRPGGSLPIGRHPYLPFVLGGAAMACVLGLGLSIMNNRGHASPVSGGVGSVPLTTRASFDGPSPEVPARTLSGGVTGVSGAQSAALANPPSVNAATYGVGGDPFVSRNGNASMVETSPGNNINRAPARYRNYGGALPDLRMAGNGGGGNAGGGSDSGSTQPLPPIIAVPPGANNGATNGGYAQNSPYGATESSSNGGGIRIAAGPPTGSNSNGSSATGAASPNGPGYIHITVGAPTSAATSGASNAASASPASARGAATPAAVGSPLTRARNLQATGRYADAIAAYREALASDSGSAGAAQQGIAQSEQSLHDDGAARTAYREALHAYQSQLSAGRNASAARRGIDVCNAALEALGG